MIRQSNVDLAAPVGADLGEGPCWDPATKSLLFVDVTAGHVHRFRPGEGRLSTFEIGQNVGAAIPRRHGGLVLARSDGIATCDDDGSNQRLIAPIEADNPANRMNDAKCDPKGRLLAGTMAYDFAAGAATLYQIDATHAVTPVIEAVTISNGLGWSPDGTLMYYIDSAHNSVDVIAYDSETGKLGQRRRLISVPQVDGMPDGMAVDAEGCLWVALWGGGRVRRYGPNGTDICDIVLPVSQVTSVAFGGDHLTDLYITSAAYKLTPSTLQAEPLAGALFRASPGVVGLPTTPYAG
jgi:sugar lactone lactonase YvrE